MRALINAYLIDGTGGPAKGDQTVLIDGERIAEVGAREEVTIPPTADVTDLGGMTLLPGLIDCHDHIAGSVYGLVGRWELDAPPSLRHLRTAEVLRKTLDTGYTAMRDAGGLDKGFQTAIEGGLIPGPRMVLSLSIMSPTGGIGDWASPSGHRRPEPGNVSLPPGVANGVDAVRAKVRELDRMGADVIKFATTGGASSRPGHGPKDIAFGRDEIFAIVEEAHALGKRAMCHAIGGPGLRLAVEAGADSIEHGSYLDEDPDLLPMMAEKGTFFVPTLTVYAFHRKAPEPHFSARAQAMYTHQTESIQKALELRVRVVAGTDAGSPFNMHSALTREMQHYIEAGLTPMEVIQSATLRPAQMQGVEKDLGTVTEGKYADMVIVDGDPLTDINAVHDVVLVVKDGEVVIDNRD